MKALTLKNLVVPEVALLAILVAGLVISHGIVVRRSYIKLSPPYEVPASGFSFSMPQSSGWLAVSTGAFEDNAYYSTCVRRSSSGQNESRVVVAYLLAAGQFKADDWLRSKSAQLGARFTRSQIIKGHNVVTHAIMIDMRGRSLNIVYGVATLSGGRNVVIEGVDTSDDPEMAWTVLTAVAESFTFKGNPLLEAGEKVIASLRDKGVGKLLGTSRRDDYFLVSVDNQVEGFEVDMYASTGSKDEMNVRAINSYYLRNRGGRENVLQTNDRFDKFLWLNSIIDDRGAQKRIAEVQLDADAIMSVRLLTERSVTTSAPGRAAIPDPLSMAVFREMLADGTKEAIFDFISLEGRIKPGLVQIQKQAADSNDRAAIVTIKYFIDVDVSQEVHLDADGQIDKAIISGEMPYTLRRSSKDAVLDEFPLWIDYIGNLDKQFRDNVPDDGKNPRRIVGNVRTRI